MDTSDCWVLRGARVARTGSRAEQADIEIRAGRIAHLGRRRAGKRNGAVLDLRGCMILPGLINAHDHLELNLFPRLGRGPYRNAGAWSRDIHRPGEPPVSEQLRVPLGVRLRWGGIKNLLGGATTVNHHNPYHARIFKSRFPVRVQKRYGWAHSMEFSPDLSLRFRRTPAAFPFLLHLGEATDGEGKLEILRLADQDLIDRRTVLIHAVALDRRGLKIALERGASLVWCPSSNLFILGKTVPRFVFRSGIPVALGTDSALSGEGDILDELRVARDTGKVSPSRLFRMVTEDAARVLRLERGAGTISEGAAADLIVVRDDDSSPAALLLSTRTGGMELVMVYGCPRLASADLLAQLPPALQRRFHPIEIESDRVVFLDADVSRLYRATSRVLGAGFRLAGKRVSVP